MSAARIKLCGLSRPDDVAAANAVRPDYVGFVIDCPRSRRSVGLPLLRALAAGVGEGIGRVGVVVDQPVDVVAGLLREGAIDVAQLHGHEDDGYIAALRASCDAVVWQAFRVRGSADVERALASVADMVLLDAGQGSGTTFDWSLVEGFGARRPFVLAGGLAPDNVARAIRELRPWGVDMSSGIETAGVKDPAKMAAAVAAVRALGT